MSTSVKEKCNGYWLIHSRWKQRDHQTVVYSKPLRLWHATHLSVPILQQILKQESSFSCQRRCVTSLFCSYFLLLQGSRVKPSQQTLTKSRKTGRSRDIYVKWVGHFGSVGAGSTKSPCSLEGECDRGLSRVYTGRRVWICCLKQNSHGWEGQENLEMERKKILQNIRISAPHIFSRLLCQPLCILFEPHWKSQLWHF